MKRLLMFVLASLLFFQTNAQQWVNEAYQYDSTYDVVYGHALNFLNQPDTLKMDIYNPYCSQSGYHTGLKPLVIVVHGGAFLDGDKGESNITAICKAFARRGYMAASVNYRLGMVSSDKLWTCNFPNYSCFFTADTAEWFRAYYRGIQDVKGALRYLINRHDIYQIDSNNIFLVGESAGAFIALGVGLMDTAAEKPMQADSLPYVPLPNANTMTCPHNVGKTFPPDSIKRPDLGSIEGNIEPSSIRYTIKGIGNFYGGMMSNLLKHQKNGTSKPVIYSFHQPCDLVVPIDSGKIFKGISWCMTNGYNCYAIGYTPKIYGSRGVSRFNTQNNYGYNTLDEFTSKTFPNSFLIGDGSCVDQVNNPCHGYDNFKKRLGNLVDYFALKVSSDSFCVANNNTTDTSKTGIQKTKNNPGILFYPNPNTGNYLELVFEQPGVYQVLIHDNLGRRIFNESFETKTGLQHCRIHTGQQIPGLYHLQITNQKGFNFSSKYVKK